MIPGRRQKNARLTGISAWLALLFFGIVVTAILVGFMWVWLESPRTAEAIQVVLSLVTLAWFLFVVKNLDGFFNPMKSIGSLIISVLFFFVVLLPVFGIWAIAIGIGVSMVVMVMDIERFKKRIQGKT